MVSYRVNRASEVDWEAYASIPIAYTVEARIDLKSPSGEPLPVTQWTKDYDAYEGPQDWPHRFDMRNWHAISAWDSGHRIGGAVIAMDTPGVDMLEGRPDLAVLWDIRVAPGHRGHGVGRALFLAAVKLARSMRCTELKVETQDVNVGACRFYAAQGFVLSEIRPGAYEELPDEAMMIWRLSLNTK